MDILYLLIPLSIVLVFLIGAVLLFAVRSGQFENLDRPDYELLADDDSVAAPPRTQEEGEAGGARSTVSTGAKVV